MLDADRREHEAAAQEGQRVAADLTDDRPAQQLARADLHGAADEEVERRERERGEAVVANRRLEAEQRDRGPRGHEQHDQVDPHDLARDQRRGGVEQDRHAKGREERIDVADRRERAGHRHRVARQVPGVAVGEVDAAGEAAGGEVDGGHRDEREAVVLGRRVAEADGQQQGDRHEQAGGVEEDVARVRAHGGRPHGARQRPEEPAVPAQVHKQRGERVEPRGAADHDDVEASIGRRAGDRGQRPEVGREQQRAGEATGEAVERDPTREVDRGEDREVARVLDRARGVADVEAALAQQHEGGQRDPGGGVGEQRRAAGRRPGRERRGDGGEGPGGQHRPGRGLEVDARDHERGEQAERTRREERAGEEGSRGGADEQPAQRQPRLMTAHEQLGGGELGDGEREQREGPLVGRHLEVHDRERERGEQQQHGEVGERAQTEDQRAAADGRRGDVEGDGVALDGGLRPGDRDQRDHEAADVVGPEQIGGAVRGCVVAQPARAEHVCEADRGEQHVDAGERRPERVGGVRGGDREERDGRVLEHLAAVEQRGGAEQRDDEQLRGARRRGRLLRVQRERGRREHQRDEAGRAEGEDALRQGGPRRDDGRRREQPAPGQPAGGEVAGGDRGQRQPAPLDGRGVGGDAGEHDREREQASGGVLEDREAVRERREGEDDRRAELGERRARGGLLGGDQRGAADDQGDRAERAERAREPRRARSRGRPRAAGRPTSGARAARRAGRRRPAARAEGRTTRWAHRPRRA